MKQSWQVRRSDCIRQWLMQEGSLRVADLVSRLAVTPTTIRRDLNALAEKGVLIRTLGGCTIQSPIVRDRSFSEKDALYARQKSAIAREAARMIAHGQTLFIDTGTTTLHFACSLPDTKNLRVFTNNLRVAIDLFSRPGFEVIVFGGKLAKKSPDLFGEVAMSNADEFQIDTAVIGADAVDPVQGEAYAADIATANLSRIVQRRAMSIVILADSSKLAKRSLVRVARLHEGVTLITDDGATLDDLATLRKTGAEIIVARVDNGFNHGDRNERAPIPFAKPRSAPESAAAR